MAKMPAANPRPSAHLERPDALARETFTISDLSSEFGVTARALRFYEDEGLIAPTRSGLSRVYSKRDRARLAWIMRAKNVGFSLGEIREMIDLYDLGDGRAQQRRVTIARCRDKIAEMKEQRRDIDSAICELSDFVAGLESGDLTPSHDQAFHDQTSHGQTSHGQTSHGQTSHDQTSHER